MAWYSNAVPVIAGTGALDSVRLAKVITPKTAHLTDHTDFVSITQIMAHLQNLKIINFFKPIFLRQKSILCKSGDDKLLEIDYIYYII